MYRGCPAYLHAACIQAICNRERVPWSRAEKILQQEMLKLKQEEEKIGQALDQNLEEQKTPQVKVQ